MIPNLSKEMIGIMQQLRKRLRSEFDVDLKLSQTDIIQQLFQWSEKSHDQRSKLLFADLEDMLGIEISNRPINDDAKTDEQTAVSEFASKRIYRGHVIEDAPVVAMQKTQRIYRGQVVA